MSFLIQFSTVKAYSACSLNSFCFNFFADVISADVNFVLFDVIVYLYFVDSWKEAPAILPFGGFGNIDEKFVCCCCCNIRR